MRKAILIPLLAFAALFAASDAGAVLTIRITGGTEGAQPIAVVPFAWQGGSAGPPQQVGEIISADLARTGMFRPVAPGDLPALPSEPDAIRFSDWRLLGTANLVIGNVRPASGGRYVIHFRLFDVFRASQIAGLEVEATSSRELRRRAHQISDLIYERLTGERGAFDTRIAYVTQLKLDTGDRYALQIADSDGYGASTVLESSQPVLSPAWSPDGKRLAYVSYEGGRPSVYVQDLATGRRDRVAAFPGLNGAPAWSPDGSRLAVTLSKDGNAEIYVIYLASKRLQRLTVNNAIDTESAWSPDGEWIVFTSDRGGQPQIYRMPSSGGRAERLTFDGPYNARASYSPDGTRLTLIHSDNGAFRVSVLDLKNSALRVLSDTSLDESPSFSPNGVMILYATTDAQGSALAAVSIDGRVHQRLAVQQGAVREPAWSPYRAR